jgi:hypothetical protein
MYSFDTPDACLSANVSEQISGVSSSGVASFAKKMARQPAASAAVCEERFNQK